ncbi:MAG: O-antigen ligase family protein [Sulfurimonas sp.]|nr:O-antigen ligase family protein [Sulfurimonas sp.]
MENLFLIHSLSLIVLFSYLVLITQSRQVWLALLIVALIAPIAYIMIHKATAIQTALISLTGILLLLFLFSNSDTLQKRLLEEQNTFNALIENNQTIEMTSIGIRINSWMDAKEWIIRHPILGLEFTCHISSYSTVQIDLMKI